MKITIMIMLLTQQLFAGSGFEEVGKLYQEGTKLDLTTLKTTNLGVYVGKCFRGSIPNSAFLGFKNLSENSGPLPIDPEMAITWGAAESTDYYEKIDIKRQLLPFLKYLISYLDEDILGVNLYEWTYEWKQSGNYIVQENRRYGNIFSYCYYYQFRE